MTTPVLVGWPQLILFLIGLIGLGLLISALMGVTRERREVRIDEDGRTIYRRRRRFGIGRAFGGVVLVALAVSLLWAVLLVQSYLGLLADVPVAQVRATQIEGLPHQMSVELTQYDKDGHPLASKTYLVKGDRWMLQGDILKFSPWLNIFGVHSAYKLTRLEGQYDDPNMESNEKHTVIVLNGGEDGFFKTTYKQAWSSPFVEAAYGNAAIEPADGLPYNVLASQTGFYPKPAK